MLAPKRINHDDGNSIELVYDEDEDDVYGSEGSADDDEGFGHDNDDGINGEAQEDLAADIDSFLEEDFEFTPAPGISNDTIDEAAIAKAAAQARKDGLSTVDFESVSDTEALLACRWFLQKRKLMSEGWYEAGRRKSVRKDKQRQFLWNTLGPPKELMLPNTRISEKRFFPSKKNKKAHRNDDSNVEKFFPGLKDQGYDFMDEDDIEDDEEGRLQVERAPMDLFAGIERGKCDNRLEKMGKMFTSLPVGPSESYVRRSKRMKDKFADPEWKAKWYRKRFGDPEKAAARRRETKMKQAVRQWSSKRSWEDPTPTTSVSKFMASDELSSMSPEEIMYAIQAYRWSGERRSKTRQKSSPKRRRPRIEVITPETKPSKLEVFLNPELREAAMKEMQVRRAEIARKRERNKFEKRRLLNPKPKPGEVQVIPPEFIPRGTNAEDAIRRIQICLDQGERPLAQDVRYSLVPKRLRGRKRIFVRILYEVLDMNGQCVPPLDVTDATPHKEYDFPLLASIAQLGKLIVEKLDEMEKEDGTKPNRESDGTDRND